MQVLLKKGRLSLIKSMCISSILISMYLVLKYYENHFFCRIKAMEEASEKAKADQQVCKASNISVCVLQTTC